MKNYSAPKRTTVAHYVMLHLAEKFDVTFF